MHKTWTALTRKMSRFSFLLGVLLIALLAGSNAVASDWLSAPKPKFPNDALKKGSEGSVKLRVLLTQDVGKNYPPRAAHQGG